MEKPKRVRKATTEPAKVLKPERDMEPSINPDYRDQQMVHLAYELAAKQMQEGTAAASTICHFLKLGSKREFIEQEILEKQKSLLQAKTESISKGVEMEKLTTDALAAFKQYQGKE